jgi:DtxR family transcriptional regulator, Mn-dependent transcriptional regulator
MNQTLTHSIQDYLKAIYQVTEREPAASTTALAARLGVEPASVTGMLQKLASARPPSVNYRKHHGATLTATGRRAALEVIRHHRLLETWLVKTLGYSWDEVHVEAERLEHAISEEFEERIAAALGDPTRDPHGEPIPSSDLVMPSDGSVPLSGLEQGQRATVCRAQADDPAFLRHLESLGLTPGASLIVKDVSRFDHLMTVEVAGKPSPVVLGPAITEHVYVETQYEW